MKKNGKSQNKVLSLVLTVSMILSCFPFVGFAAQESSFNENITSLETVFVNEAGEDVYESVSGKVRAVSYAKSEVAMNVMTSVAVYEDNSLVDISAVSDKLTAGGNVLSTDFVTLEAGQTARAFVWDNSVSPLCVDALYGSVGKKAVTSATITVGGTAYQANVDRVNKEISVMVPVKYYTDADDEWRIKAYNTVYENLKSAAVEINGNYASISPAASGTYDLLNTNPQITLTDANGSKTVYTVKATVGDWGRNYNAEGATLDPGTASWQTTARKGMPAYMSADTGNGTWLAGVGSFFDSTTLEPNGINTLSIETENDNDYIHIVKGSVEGATKSMTFYSTGSLSKNSQYETEFKLRINSLSGERENLTFMDIWSSNTDKLTLSGDGASDGKYRIAHNRYNGSGSEMQYVPGVELSLGKWYTIKYVYTANSMPVSGTDFTDYEMQLYIDGKLVDVYSHGVTSNPQNAGTLQYINDVASYPQVAFNPFTKTVLDMDIDDVKVKAVSDFRSFDTSLKSATLSFGGNTYTGLINTDRKTITFDVPESVATAANIANAKATITPNVSTVTTTLSSTDLTSAVTVAVSAPAGNTDTYTLRVEPSSIARTYDAEGATIESGVPSVLANEGGVSSKWVISGSPAITVPVENGNQYIKVVGAGADSYFGSVISGISDIYADKITAQFKIRLDSIPSGMASGATMARIRAAHGDFLTLNVVDAAKGTYTLAKSNMDAKVHGNIENAPVLKVGEWHTLSYVSRRYSDTANPSAADWYAIEIYVDGEFIGEIQGNATGGTTADSWHYTNLGRFSPSITNYGQLSINFLSAFTSEGSISLDDLYVSYMIDWSPTDSSVLYAPNCPVAIVADDSGIEVSYPVTLKQGEAVIDIPFTPVSDEENAINGTDWPEIHPDVTNAVILFPDNMKASLGASDVQSGAVVLNLNDANTLNISTNGSTPAGYNVKTEYSETLAKSSSAATATSSNAYTLSASYVPQDYSCKKMNASSNITLDAFSDTDEAVISLYGTDIAKLTVSDGKIKFSGMSSEFSYSPELETGDTVRFDCAVRNGNTAEVFADGIYMGSVSINTVSVLPASNHFGVKCTGSAKLTLENVILSVINSLLDDKTVVHIIGDSIVQYYGNDVKGISKDIEGWGRYMCDEFNEDTVVLNHARSGYNTNIYLNGTNRPNFETRERWSSIKDRMKNGDYLIIFLAWNEENSIDGTKTEEAYKANMNKIISDAKALGVTPLVCTPPVSATHWTDTSTGIVKSRINNEKETWAQYVRDIALDNGIVCLDLNTALLEDVWKDAYRYNPSSGVKNNTQAGWDISNNIYETYFRDGLHVKRAGAQLYKDTLVNLLKSSDSTLKNKLK